jgi:hypothetical protein
MIDITLLSTSQDFLMSDNKLVETMDKASALSSLLAILKRASTATFSILTKFNFAIKA